MKQTLCKKEINMKKMMKRYLFRISNLLIYRRRIKFITNIAHLKQQKKT